MNSTVEYRNAQAALTDAETALAEGRGGPYGAQSVESHRRRVDRLKGQVPPPVVAGIALSLAPVAPKPAAKPEPRLAGTREDRLKHLARAMGADHRLLAQAIASEASPDEFALEILDSRDPEAIAARIIASDRPAPPNKVDAEADAVVERILAA